MSIGRRLDARRAQPPAAFEAAVAASEAAHNKAGYVPRSGVEELFPDTFYLKEVDAMFRRTYDVRT